MAIPLELVRVLNKMEGEIAEAAKQVIQQADVRVGSQDESAARRQFKLAVEAAQQANDLETLRAFLAYQARERDKVWGRSVGGRLLVQVAWIALQNKIQSFESRANKEEPNVWRKVSSDTTGKNEVQLAIASRFFAYIERAFEIWKDKQAREFYFTQPVRQGQSTPAQQGGGQGGA